MATEQKTNFRDDLDAELFGAPVKNPKSLEPRHQVSKGMWLVAPLALGVYGAFIGVDRTAKFVGKVRSFFTPTRVEL
jgi:hypothetical protein